MGDWDSKSTAEKVGLTLAMVFFWIGVATCLGRY